MGWSCKEILLFDPQSENFTARQIMDKLVSSSLFLIHENKIIVIAATCEVVEFDIETFEQLNKNPTSQSMGWIRNRPELF
jgi:hypothetical protein